jgi:hypothetical protein
MFENVSKWLTHLQSYRNFTVYGLLRMTWLNLRRLGCTGLQVAVRVPPICNAVRNFLHDPPYDMSLVRMNTSFVS